LTLGDTLVAVRGLEERHLVAKLLDGGKTIKSWLADAKFWQNEIKYFENLREGSLPELG
jgi:hypothetical protein